MFHQILGQKNVAKTLKKEAFGFPRIFSNFSLLCNFFKFHHFKQTISEKLNIFRNNVIMAKPEKVLRYFDAITWNNHYGQSIKSTHFLLLDHFEPFTEYGNWNYVSHMSRLQIPK